MSVVVSVRVSGCTGSPAGLSNASSASSSKTVARRIAGLGRTVLSAASASAATEIVSPRGKE